MSHPLRKNHPLMKPMNYALIDLPAPVNLSIWWNMGSLLGLMLIIQIITGLFLAMHYTPHLMLAFSSVIHIMQDVNYGWAIRHLHANGASFFFIFMYIHIGRGIYYGSYKYKETWTIGVIIFILSMATAFMGYVLPWGQMSFWGATVITNLFSAIPYVGKTFVEWLWGGFAVDNATLNRFFSLHFTLPFILIAMVAMHLVFLHQSGSNNPLGTPTNMTKVPFHWYYTSKDLMGALIALTLLFSLIMLSPDYLGDPENFNPANPLVTPTHIKPEWYFLWAYAILRSIPNKLGGVLAMMLSLVILFILPPMNLSMSSGNAFYPINQIFFWGMTSNFFLLTWIGGRPVEMPFETLGKLFTFMYFLFFFINPVLLIATDKLMTQNLKH